MTIRSPRRGEVWVHVDRLDRDDGRVMAVQWRGAKGGPYYQTFHKVEWHGCGYVTTKFFGRRSTRQPRLVIVVPRGLVEAFDVSTNLRIARIVVPSPTTSSGVDRRRPGRV